MCSLASKYERRMESLTTDLEFEKKVLFSPFTPFPINTYRDGRRFYRTYIFFLLTRLNRYEGKGNCVLKRG